MLQAHELEAMLDFFVFQWARGYLRLRLMPPQDGSQLEEVHLQQKMMQVVYSMLRTKGKLKAESRGVVHV